MCSKRITVVPKKPTKEGVPCISTGSSFRCWLEKSTSEVLAALCRVPCARVHSFQSKMPLRCPATATQPTASAAAGSTNHHHHQPAAPTTRASLLQIRLHSATRQTTAQLLPNYCPTTAQLLPNYCPTAAQLLPGYCPTTAQLQSHLQEKTLEEPYTRRDDQICRILIQLAEPERLSLVAAEASECLGGRHISVISISQREDCCGIERRRCFNCLLDFNE